MAPIHEACYNNDVSEVKRILDQDDSLKDLEDQCGDTPLMYCAVRGSLESLKLLGERGADVNRKDDNGHTAAHFAAYWGELECLKYLVEHCGADVTVEDNDGETPLDRARRRGKQSCEEYVEELYARYQKARRARRVVMMIARRMASATTQILRGETEVEADLGSFACLNYDVMEMIARYIEVPGDERQR